MKALARSRADETAKATLRNTAIRAAAAHGMRASVIAREAGLTPERVRQIVGKETTPA